MKTEMETSNFDIECLNCGSNNVVIVTAEDCKKIKCVNCNAEEEI